MHSTAYIRGNRLHFFTV